MKKVICLIIIVLAFSFPGCNSSNKTSDLERVNIGDISVLLDKNAIENNSNEFNYYIDRSGIIVHCLAANDKNNVRSYFELAVKSLNGGSFEDVISSMKKQFEEEGIVISTASWEKGTFSGVEVSYDSASFHSNQGIGDRSIVFKLPNDDENYYWLGAGYERDASEKEVQELRKAVDSIIDSLDVSSTEYKSVGYYCELSEQMRN